MLLRILFILFMSYGIFNIITHFLVVPSGATYKIVGALTKTDTALVRLQKKMYKVFINPVAKQIAKLIKMEKYKYDKMQRDLMRVGYTDITPTEYYARAIAVGLYIILVGVFLLVLQLKLFAILSFCGAFVVAFAMTDELRDKLKKRNIAIRDELPQFIRTYNYSISANTKNVDIMEKYRQIAGEAFQYDLDVLITDLKTGNEEDAFLSFDRRINLPEISTFVNGVLGQLRGVDQHDYFAIMEREMKVIAKERLKREMEKRPGKVKWAVYGVGAMLIVMYLYPIILDLKNGMGIFM